MARLLGRVALVQPIEGATQLVDPATTVGEQYGTALSRSLFTAADGTSLNAYSPEIGPDWVEERGDWEIQSNEATTAGALPTEPKFVATVDLGTPDVMLDAIAYLTASASMMLLMRYQDTSNLTVAQFFSDGLGGGSVSVWEQEAGVWTERVNIAHAIDTATDYRITASICDTTLRLAIDGVYIGGYTTADVAPSATRHGMRMEGTAISPYKSLVIWPRHYAY